MAVVEIGPPSGGPNGFKQSDEKRLCIASVTEAGMSAINSRRFFHCVPGGEVKISSALLLTLVAGLFLLLSHSVLSWAAERSDTVPSYAYKVVASYPHDPEAFTQGLVVDEGNVYEGTGLNGRSSLRRVNLATGEVLQQYNIPLQFFAEGITVFGDKIIQLTWKSKFGFVYDKSSFMLLRVFTYPHEGWGLTQDGSQLISSDGTATIRFLDPLTFAVNRSIDVVDKSGPVTNLNELEYVNGRIYANVWHSDRIAIIDPADGRVTGWLDMSGLLGKEAEGRTVDVLNGIAYDPVKDSLYVTGKLWPRLFEIKLIPLHDE